MAELLEAYPQLEDVLIDLAPAFKKLKNPLLRKTIARVTSLQQAASVGEVPVEVIVNKLRGIVGQEELHDVEGGGDYRGDRPKCWPTCMTLKRATSMRWSPRSCRHRSSTR